MTDPLAAQQQRFLKMQAIRLELLRCTGLSLNILDKEACLGFARLAGNLVEVEANRPGANPKRLKAMELLAEARNLWLGLEKDDGHDGPKRAA